MEIVKRKNYKHYTYARKHNVPVIDLESLIDKTITDRKKLIESITMNIMSRIDFSKLGRVSRILAIESDRKILSDSNIERTVFEMITDAISNFITTRDVAFYDSEFIGICIFAGKNNKHGMVIYPKLDLPK